MKPSLRAPVLGSVTSLKLNHWLLERKNMHISGPPPPPPPLNWSFKTRSVPLAQCYVSWKPTLNPSPSQPSRTFGGRSSPSERRHLSIQPDLCASQPPSSREKCPKRRSFARWVDAEGRGEAAERQGWDSSCHQSRVKFVWEALSMGEIPNPDIIPVE